MFRPTRDDGEAPITATDRGASSGCKSRRVIVRAPLYGAWDQPQGSTVRGPLGRGAPRRRRPRPVAGASGPWPGHAHHPVDAPLTHYHPPTRPVGELPNGARASILTPSPRLQGDRG